MKDGDVLNNDYQEHKLYINEKGSCLPQPPKNYDEVPNFIIYKYTLIHNNILK